MIWHIIVIIIIVSAVSFETGWDNARYILFYVSHVENRPSSCTDITYKYLQYNTSLVGYSTYLQHKYIYMHIYLYSMAILYYIRGYIRVWQIKHRTNQFSELARKKWFWKKKCEEKYSPKYFPVPIQYIRLIRSLAYIIWVYVYTDRVSVSCIYIDVSTAVYYI